MKKNKLSKEEVIRLSQLAKLYLNDDEVKMLIKQLEDTLNYVNNLQQLDTKQVAPTHHTLTTKNIFFNDGLINHRRLSKSLVFKNTKAKKNNYFIIQRIL